MTSTLLLEPVSKGTIPSVYTSDSLLTLMPKKEWDEKLIRELYIKHEGEYSFKEVAYVPRDFSLVTITWKQHIDQLGQVTSREPFALGVFLGAEAIPFREELLIGYLSFAEVYQSAKAINGNKQLLRLLDSIVSDTYMGYLSHTSEIMVAREEGKE